MEREYLTTLPHPTDPDLQYVLAHTPGQVQPFVTWVRRKDDKSTFWGHYFKKREDAERDLKYRAGLLTEREIEMIVCEGGDSGIWYTEIVEVLADKECSDAELTKLALAKWHSEHNIQHNIAFVGVYSLRGDLVDEVESVV